MGNHTLPYCGLSPREFDAEVKRLRSSVPPTSTNRRKASCTPAQWAAHLNYTAARTAKWTDEQKQRHAKRRKEWHHANREQVLEKKRQYREARREELSAKQRARYASEPEKYREIGRRVSRNNYKRRGPYIQEWRKRNADKMRVYYRDRQRTKRSTPLGAMISRLRARLRSATQRPGPWRKRGRTEEMLGCTFAEFVAHIESLFLAGMTWNNRSEWHLDHVIPIALAKNERDVLLLFNYRNVRPVWAADNLAKHDKVVPEARAVAAELGFCLP